MRCVSIIAITYCTRFSSVLFCAVHNVATPQESAKSRYLLEIKFYLCNSFLFQNSPPDIVGLPGSIPKLYLTYTEVILNLYLTYTVSSPYLLLTKSRYTTWILPI